MSRIKAVFLDAGQTLLHPHPDVGTVYAEATARMGVRLPPETYVAAFVPVFREFVGEYAVQSDSSDAQDYAMWREITLRLYGRIEALHGLEFDLWFDALYRRFGEAEVWRLYDDVAPTLAALREKGLRLGIVSNWDSRLRGICAGLGLDRRVDFIVISAEAGVRKPDARIFQMALERAGVEPHEAVHVGDLLEEDVAGARRAGVRALLIDRSRRYADGARPADVEVVESLADFARAAGILE